jgi:hypothetical protein
MLTWFEALINKDNAGIAQGWAGVAQAFFAFALICIGGIQIAIYWRMRRIMTDQLEVIRKQIALARDEFRASHRPQIIVHSVRLLPFEKGRPIDRRPLVAEFAIVNAGTANCRISGSAVRLAFSRPVDKLHLPDLPPDGIIRPQRFDVGQTNNSVTVTAIVSAGDEYEAGFVGDSAEIGGNDAAVVGRVLYLNGWVAYCEKGDSTRTTYFRRMYNPRINRFVMTGDPDDEKTY